MSSMITPLPSKKYLNDLKEIAGLSDSYIGDEIGMSRISVWRLRTGKHKSTSYEFGVKIANLHARVFRKRKRKSGQ